MPTPHHPCAAARKALKKLGAGLHDARRRRRRLPMAVLAERAFTSRSTLQRIESGDPAVSEGNCFLAPHTIAPRPADVARSAFERKMHFEVRHGRTKPSECRTAA